MGNEVRPKHASHIDWGPSVAGRWLDQGMGLMGPNPKTGLPHTEVSLI